MRIEIGGGAVPVDATTMNLDPVHGEGEWRRPAQDVPWPCEDGTVESVRASHVMEHVPAADRIAVFNEAWRVLRPGGSFEVVVPILSASLGPSGQVLFDWGALADPTHVSLWVRESFAYFTGAIRPNAEYGISLWREQSWRVERQPFGDEGHWTGVKP